MSELNFTQDLSSAINEYIHGCDQENPNIKHIHEKMNASLNQIWKYFSGNHEGIRGKMNESDVQKGLREFLSSFEKINGFSENEQKEVDITVANIAIAIRKENPDIFIQEMLRLFGIHIFGGRFRQGNMTVQPIRGAIFTTKYRIRRVLVQKPERIDVEALFAGVSFIDTENQAEGINPAEEQRVIKLYQYTIDQFLKFQADILELPIPFLEELMDFFHCYSELNIAERSLRGKTNILDKIQDPQDKTNGGPKMRRGKKIEINQESADILALQKLKTEIAQIKRKITHLRNHLHGLKIERYPTNNEIWTKLHGSFGLTPKKNKFAEDKIIGNRSDATKIVLRALLTIANKVNATNGDDSAMSMQNIHKLIKQISQKNSIEIPESWSQSAVRRALDRALAMLALGIKIDYKFELPERRITL